MGKIETIKGNNRAMKNIANLRSRMKKKGLTYQDIQRLTGLNSGAVSSYELGVKTPSVDSYNALAKVFGWVAIKKSTDYNETAPAKPAQKVQEDALPPPCEIPLPKPVTFTFKAGHVYKIRRGSYKEDENFLFQYERKEGTHHIFHEIHGGWTRTHTDAQLIGMEIEEITDNGKNKNS